ncbi:MULTISPECIES: ATP-binding protein [Streptomyces]|uniref:ATP-binding protein n=1 Tax=Streptomyces asoensis TaxID=249586 RepID=A0ABQ3S4B5_9ACTN|nr:MULTISPECIES: ATP-binding protein [Streptomyces]MBK3624765.1 ATP-binding protein [Streptomyces sp. MBT49]MBK3634781.1 ATP-binding protein [Streptomyces sp. MBT97]GGQ59460.1 ATP-binding protein [Streptomyces asoensis]GHI62959.1 ATP-binding protein [Streptomyces asoensis]
MLRRNSFRLPRHPASVGLARRRVRDHLAAWGHGPDDPAVGAAVLVVSELATNVVRHGPAPGSAHPGEPHPEREFEVAVTALGDGSCLIEVSDGSRLEPRPRHVAETDEHGRGLHLVEHLATAWGVWSAGRHGKTVWALLTATA